MPEGYVSQVAVGDAVAFTVPSLAVNRQQVMGRIAHISPVAESGSHTFESTVTVDNVLTVPLSAIVMRDDQRTVYVIDDGLAVRRVLTTGYIGEDVVEVLGGITEEDEIITGGLNKVREGIQVRTVEGASAE